MRVGGGLLGLVGDMVRRSEENAAAERQRENVLVAAAGYGRNMPEESMNTQPAGMQLAPGMNLADLVGESMRYAQEMTVRTGSAKEGVLPPADQLRRDYLVFLGYLHNPEHADPVQQVGMVNSVLRMNLTPQAYFQLRNDNSLDPEVPERVPESLKYFVQDDQAGGSGPINSGFCMSRFLVNTFRDLGHTYICFGGVSELELNRLTVYIKMMNRYLQEKGLFHTMDPFRKGETGAPYFGLPVNPEDTGGINMPGSGGIDMPGSGGINMPGSGGINMPGAGGINMPGSGGIDMPGSKGIDMPGAGTTEAVASESLEGRGGFSLGDRDGESLGERGGFSLGDRDGESLGERGGFSLGDRDGESLGERGSLSPGGRDALGFAEGEGLGLGDRDDFYL